MMDDRSQAELDDYIRAAKAGFESETNWAYEQIDALGTGFLREFARAKLDRQETEQRWLEDYRQFKGEYEPEVLARIGVERSQAFVKATRVKVKTVDARTADLLFPANSERNYSVEATDRPSLDVQTRQSIHQALAAQLQRKPEPLELESAFKKYADASAQRMAQVIDDQLTECQYKKKARRILHSGHVFGTGILKAPLVTRKERTKYVQVVQDGKRQWVKKTERYVTPFVEHTPIWNFYPDMNATELEDCRYVFELHRFTRDKMASLTKFKSFNKQRIIDYINAYPNGHQVVRDVDNELRRLGDRESVNVKDDGSYELLERWGYINGDDLVQCGVDVPSERLHEAFFANVWLLPDGVIIKIAIWPLACWPYHLYYCEKDDTSIFGEGIPAIMRDDQEMINAGTRMILDHAAIASGFQIEANMALLSEHERAESMGPYKIWKRNGNEPGSPALRVLQMPNGLDLLMPIVEMFRTNADDVTAIPRYMQGENATAGAAGTASGMSMLMAAASVVMKDLISNFDDMTRSFIESLHMWNMQFNPDDSIKGDFSIKARGTASLMAKELRAQQLDQFSQMAGNPLDQPYIKRRNLLQQRAEAHDLSDVVKTEEEVAAEQNNQQAQQQAQMQMQVQQLQMQLQQSELQRASAEIAKLLAEVERIKAITVKTKVDSAYAGMQAGGVATERPEIAPAGDAILNRAGWGGDLPTGQSQASDQVAASIQEAGLNAEGQDNNPLTPPSANVGANLGERSGIRTPGIE